MMLCIAGLVACSTKKNTALSRFHHILNTKYNVNFNGRNAYTDGLKKIEKANEDDYSQVIPLYPISNHESAKAASSEMDRVIEKSRKAIKLHSIQKKPKKNNKKWGDPKYKAWYNQQEFNTALDEAWMLLGQAEFHKADFIGAIGDFMYIKRHYPNDADMQARCDLWIARSYAEMDWIYEAEDAYKRVNQDALTKKNSSLYAAFSADLLLKQKQYTQALPFLQLALPSEKRNMYKPRFWFVLAQCQALNGQTAEAIENYQKVIKSQTEDLQLEFHARLNRARLQGDKKALKQLKRMTRNYKYKDQLDQVYGTLADVALDKRDTLQALQYYRQAIDTAANASMAKASILVKAADLYYQLHDYEHAQPYYAEAAGLLSATHADYERVNRRSETLSELITQLQTIHLQDSLQALALLPEEEQLKIISRQLAEKAAADSLAQLQQQQQGQQSSGLQGVNTNGLIGGNGKAAAWYFYNSNLLKQGQQAFQKKWGTRQLEDDWRHASKTPVTSFGISQEEDNMDNPEPQDSTGIAEKDSVITDPKDPRYYLSQLPRTEEELAESNQLIATALYDAAYIYKDKIEDLPMAWATFDTLEARFPQDSTHILASYYTRYLQAMKDSDDTQMRHWSRLIQERFPESGEAKMVADPQYAQHIHEMLQQADSLYAETYQLYRKGQYQQAIQNVALAEEKYPLSSLMPKFLYVRSLCIAKTQSKQDFSDALHDLVDRYPDADVSSMAKDMIAMMNLGRESKKGGSSTDLSQVRDQDAGTTPQEESTSEQFAMDLTDPFGLLIVTDSLSQLNELLYQIATYNFSQFMIKDFDLKQVKLGEHGAVYISGFDSYTECQWYQGKINADADLQQLFETLHTMQVPISESNMNRMQTHSLEEYIQWWSN